MDELKQNTIKFFLELGFSEANAIRICDELFFYALEDTYALLLSEDNLSKLNSYIELKDTTSIQKLNSEIDNTLFLKTLSEKLSGQLLEFVKQMIDQLPPEQHQEMENRLQKIQAKEAQAQGLSPS